MQAKVSILFYAKKAKATTGGLIPIYLRVTVDGQRIEISTKRYVEAAKWSVEQGRMLVPIFENYNNQVAALLNDGFAPGTLERYKTSLKHTIDFLLLYQGSVAKAVLLFFLYFYL